MGFLSDGGGNSEDTSTNDDTAPVDDKEPAEGVEASTDDKGEEVAAEPSPRTERVDLGRRRGGKVKERDALAKEIASLKETVSKRDAEYQQALATRDADIARLRGGFDALAPLVASQRGGGAPAEATPAQLMKEAKEALDKQDLDTYHAKFAEAVRAGLPKQQTQQQQAPQMSPVVSALLSRHQHVLSAGNRGMQLAIAKDNELALMGYADGPDRYAKAFELADNMLKPPGSAQYSQQSRDVLSGIPTSRPQNGGDNHGPGVTLNGDEIKWAEAAGMSREEYAKFLLEGQPNRLER